MSSAPHAAPAAPPIAAPAAPRARVIQGLLAEFETPAALRSAARRVREAGYRRWDAHSPFPVHGLDDAMGIRRTRLPWLVLLAGLAGAGAGRLMQWGMNTIDYPFRVSGKPYDSLPAQIPIIFEVTILFAAFGAVFGMLALNGLPRFAHWVFGSRRFLRATSDRFFISIEERDPRFHETRTAELLRAAGAAHVELVTAAGAERIVHHRGAEDTEESRSF